MKELPMINYIASFLTSGARVNEDNESQCLDEVSTWWMWIQSIRTEERGTEVI